MVLCFTFRAVNAATVGGEDCDVLMPSSGGRMHGHITVQFFLWIAEKTNGFVTLRQASHGVIPEIYLHL